MKIEVVKEGIEGPFGLNFLYRREDGIEFYSIEDRYSRVRRGYAPIPIAVPINKGYKLALWIPGEDKILDEIELEYERPCKTEIEQLSQKPYDFGACVDAFLFHVFLLRKCSDCTSGSFYNFNSKLIELKEGKDGYGDTVVLGDIEFYVYVRYTDELIARVEGRLLVNWTNDTWECSELPETYPNYVPVGSLKQFDMKVYWCEKPILGIDDVELIEKLAFQNL